MSVSGIITGGLLIGASEVITLGLGSLGYAPVNGTTGSVCYIPLRLASGQWTASGVTPDADRTNLRQWLPPARVPVTDSQGFMTPTWYRFFQFLSETKLGGATAQTIPEIVASVVATLEQSANTAAAVTSVAQQTQANADSLSATVQTVQAAALPGADAIPLPQTSIDLR